MAWKISFETIVDLQMLFTEFKENCERVINYCYEETRREYKGVLNDIVKKSYYLGDDYYLEKSRSNQVETDATRSARLNKLDEIEEEFTQFLELLGFMEFGPSYFGKKIYIDFFEFTIKDKYDPSVPSNTFYMYFIGRNMTYSAAYSNFKKTVYLNVEKLRIKYDRV